MAATDEVAAILCTTPGTRGCSPGLAAPDELSGKPRSG